MPIAKINLKNYRNNITRIKSLLGDDCHLMAIVKSDAYGFGLEKISSAAYEKGVRWFGIATTEESIELRRVIKDRKINIVLVSPFVPEEAEEIIKNDIIPIVSSVEEVRRLSEVSLEQNRVSKIHLGLDTGMGRMGFQPEKLIDCLEKLQSFKGVSIEGVFSHFPSADEDDESFNLVQLEEFQQSLLKVQQKISRKFFRHIANSAAVFRYPASHMDIVRCGIATYGARSSSFVDFEGIMPVMSVEAKIVLVKEVPKGHSISYGRTYITPGTKKIALVDIGYGEGYSRHLSSQGVMLVKERRASVLGRVTMDLTIIDVSHIEDVKSGDEVIVIGRQGNETITVEDFSSSIGTIPYEVFCVMGKILPRIYID